MKKKIIVLFLLFMPLEIFAITIPLRLGQSIRLYPIGVDGYYEEFWNISEITKDKDSDAYVFRIISEDNYSKRGTFLIKPNDVIYLKNDWDEIIEFNVVYVKENSVVVLQAEYPDI